jgi:ArsR family transcriptional regulator
VFQKASELFAVLAAPMRLKIINCLRDGEQTVGELVTRIGTTQSNMSGQLKMLYQAGVLTKRRDGHTVLYSIVDERVKTLCNTICSHIQAELA